MVTSTPNTANPTKTVTNELPAHGLLVRSANTKSAAVYGVFNVDTGNYQQVAQFQPKDKGVELTIGARSVAPDWMRHSAVLTTVDGDLHAGWVDRSGVFTDVSARIHGSTSGFGAKVQETSQGFDSLGRLIYEDASQRIRRVQQIGSDPGASALTLDSGDGYIARTVYTWAFDGTLLPKMSTTCTNVAQLFGWRGPDEYLYIDGGYQINVARYPCQASADIALLPEGNNRPVGDAVVSPDHTQIMFASDAGGFRGMFVMSTNGGVPQRTSISEARTQGYKVIGWI